MQSAAPPEGVVAADEGGAAQPLRVRRNWLFALYAVIPATLLVVAYDQLRLDGELLRRWLPTNPEQWAFWTVLFGLPHIVASLVTMADREYLAHYHRRLLAPTLLITAAVVLVPLLLGREVFLIVLALYTMYHVLSQQFGIALIMLGRRPDAVFEAWRWLSTLAATAIYLSIYSGVLDSDARFAGLPIRWLIEGAVVALTAATLPLVLRLSRGATSSLARWYLWGNFAMIAVGCAYWLSGYTVFVVLIPRVIHDVTAFIIYAVHDQNRNAREWHNGVYRLFSWVRLPPWLLCPLIAIAAAWLLFDLGRAVSVPLFDTYWQPAATLAYVCTFLHYYMEGVIWKGGGLHRRAIAFT